jgi:hypothetical protein
MNTGGAGLQAASGERRRTRRRSGSKMDQRPAGIDDRALPDPCQGAIAGGRAGGQAKGHVLGCLMKNHYKKER